MRRALVVLVIAAAAIGAAPGSSARGDGDRPWLWQCEQILREDAKYRCYVRLLLLRIEASGDPARELPRIDVRAARAGTSLAGSCHVVMHEVGRRFARAHRLTLATLQRYVPRSNDPTCSAGFGMGLVMYLGPQIIGTGGRGALAPCLRLPTRYRSYTCIHGLGHALMRGYHGNLRASVESCRENAGRHAGDCAQGAFHDYWISVRGADGTTKRATSEGPRTLCNGHLTYVRPCWYRYFIEQQFGPSFATARAVERVCRGLRPLQRSGCVGAASLASSVDPFAQLRLCSRLSARDAASCLRGLAVQALTGKPTRQLALLRECGRMPRAVRRDCAEWLGRTLNVVTNGRFETRGCPKLEGAARPACVAGARLLGEPLLTFS